MNGHFRLHEQSSSSSSDADEFDSVPVANDEPRRLRRRGLMLDDGCLVTSSVQPRKYDTTRRFIYWLLCLVTAGTVAIIAYWPMCRRRKEKLLSHACPPEDADFVLVEAPDGAYEVCPVEEVAERPLELLPYMQAQATQRNKPASSIPLARRMYVYRHTRYRYRPASRAFVQVEAEELAAPADPLGRGLDSATASSRLTLLGRATIDVPIPPIPVLLVREVLHPFVIFQVWAVVVWLTESYWSFSLFILCTALLTAGLNLRDVLRNLKDIRALSRYVTTVTVLRDGGRRYTIPSDLLVPGDVVVVPRTLKLPADMVLVQGQATVTEAMLTGEATVVIKTPVVPNGGAGEDFSGAVARADMRNTLFGGTQVVELRVPKGQDVLAVVVRTGYETVKGRLVLSILHPKSSHFKFMDEALRFVGILFGCALFGFVVNAKALADNGAGPEKIVQRGADLITIVVPPALPLAVTVGTLYALMALRKDRIFCISPPKVNLAGKVNCFCFDKTGTLTTEGLELATVRPAVVVGGSGGAGGAEAAEDGGSGSAAVDQTEARSGSTLAPIRIPLAVDTRAMAGTLNSANPSLASPAVAGAAAGFLPDTDKASELSLHFAALLSCCHSLTHVAGELAGDPLELKTFAFTKARLEEPHTGEEDGHGAGSGSTHGASHEGVAVVMGQPEVEAAGSPAAGQRSSGPRSIVSSASSHHGSLTSSASSGSLVSSGTATGPGSRSGGCSPATLAGTGRGLVSKTVPQHVVSRVFLPPASALRDLAGGSVRPEFTSSARAASSTGQAVDVLHVFSFVPALQRMGVLVQPVTADAGPGGAGAVSAPVVSYVKGSPEAIHTLCQPSTLPSDYWEVLASYARQGLRVLGAGYRLLPPSTAGAAVKAGTDAALYESLRREVETGLTFLGFIVLENRLKPETAPTLALLRKEGNLSLHMATGDNGVSAIAIARQCGMVEAGARVFLADLAPEAAVTPGTAIPGAHSSGGGGAEGGAGVTLQDLVTWTDVDDPSNGLEPTTLLPRRPLVPLVLAAGIHDPAPGTAAAGAISALAQRRSALASAAGHTISSSSSSSSGGGAPGFYRLAMTGRAFEALQRQVASGALPARTLDRALINCSVFARMSPENKASLVEALQAQGMYVGMIGDGANDSMALRAAHVGISLSQVEASVAAPFTYAVPNPSIDAIPRVLAEGRGALATSFNLFQFMALYSTIQFANAVLIAFSGSFLSNNMYLFQDLFVVFILSFSLGQTPSARALTPKRPSGRLGSVYNLTITFGFIILTFICQSIAFGMVRGKPWFGSKDYPAAVPKDADAEGTNSAIPETTSLFLMANFQYVACASIFSWGHPWKQSPLTNKVFIGWLGIVALTSVALILGPTPGAYAWLSLQILPQAWHWELFGLSLAAFASYFGFMWVVRTAKAAGVFSRLERRGPPKLHKVLRKEWRAQFASAAVAEGAGMAGVALGFPVSIGPGAPVQPQGQGQGHGQGAGGGGSGSGYAAGPAQHQVSGRLRTVHSAGWDTTSSLTEPATPLPI